MIKLTNIRVPAAAGDGGITARLSELLCIPTAAVRSVSILRRSVDARRKGDVCFIYTVAAEIDGEESVLKTNGTIAASYTPPTPYTFPFHSMNRSTPPVVVGMGPAGLFAALCLAQAGLCPIILERGKPVEARIRDTETFWQTGILDTSSNVQFGEGGAGTFSDGKLTTGVNDERIGFVLNQLIEFGAPVDIRYLQKPHVGTDRLRAVVINLRQELIRLGSDIRFGHRLEDLHIENGCLTGVTVEAPEGRYHLETAHMVLAPGNSARDTFEMLDRSGIRLTAKSFSVGVRIEHKQKSINTAQYGQAATLGTLPASDYKLAVHLDGGRTVYTFCVCPGGSVIASSSETGQVVTNGMSEYSRSGENCNGGLLVSVTPEDYADTPLSGIAFQRALEKAAYVHGGENYHAPAQLVKDFLEKRPSMKAGTVKPTYKPGVTWCNLWDVLPSFVCEAIAKALPSLEKSIRGFAAPDAVMTAVETRSSSPVRIERVDYEAVGLKGLFPCGEGAGYAGGIMSAAVDGIRTAEALCSFLS